MSKLDAGTKRAGLACVLAFAALSLALVAPAQALGRGADAFDASKLRPGMLMKLEGASVIVPPRGYGVWTDALSIDGHEATLGVETHRDGSVAIYRASDLEQVAGAAVSRTRAGTSPSPCSDGAYSLYPNSMASTYNWYFKASSKPTEVSLTNVTNAVRAAAANITRGDNDCGLPDQIDATATYLGTTTASPNITATSTCSASDGKNVIGFGDLLGSQVGLTCWWTRDGQTIEADVKLNKTEYNWVVDIGSACLNRASVEGVATHELGHAFGLGHVDEALHGRLTMSPILLFCQNSESTLGLGDVRALEAKY